MPLNLIILPLELLVEILKSLGWRDIVLYVRRVCKYLADVTKTRDIWVHLVNEHVSANHLPLKLERPVEMYSSQELEHLLLLWRSAEKGLDSDALQPARERTFMGVKADMMHLINGGRWLLVTEKTAAVTYYDLDAETISGVPLIPAQMELTNARPILMSIDLDTHSPFLQFTIAFSLDNGGTRKQSTNSAESRRRVQIWRVSVALDDSQHAVGLTATCLASFPHRPEIRFVISLSLLGPNIAFTSTTGMIIYAFVVDWTQANVSPLTYPWRVMQWTTVLSTTSIHLFPSSMVLVASDVNWSLCDFSLTPETINSPDLPRYSFPVLWQVHGPPCMVLSTCFRTNDRAALVVGTSSCVSALSFDYTSVFNELPTIVELIHWTPDVSYAKTCLGYKRIVVMNHDLTIISTSPPFATPQNPTGGFRKCLLSSAPGAKAPLLDEDSGRVVYITQRSESSEPNTTEFAVVDFAMIFRKQLSPY